MFNCKRTLVFHREIYTLYAASVNLRPFEMSSSLCADHLTPSSFVHRRYHDKFFQEILTIPSVNTRFCAYWLFPNPIFFFLVFFFFFFFFFWSITLMLFQCLVSGWRTHLSILMWNHFVRIIRVHSQENPWSDVLPKCCTGNNILYAYEFYSL
jgi:hypothetical protein